MSHRQAERGILLISSYLVLSLFLVYSSAITLRTSTQRMAADLLYDRHQATNAAQAALAQLRDDFYTFFAETVYQNTNSGNAIAAMQWLDGLGQGGAISPTFNLAGLTSSGKSDATGSTPLTSSTPRSIVVPTRSGSVVAQAWISKVCDTPPSAGESGGACLPANPMANRYVTMRATATVGATRPVTKTIEATYVFELGMSDIFRYGYFVNNYGWFETENGAWVDMMGEARSNGDMHIAGGTEMYDLGDLYASRNSELINPNTGLAADGIITGTPSVASCSLIGG